MNENNQKNLQKGAILIKGDIPSIFKKMISGMLMGHLAMVVFNLTDTFFISKLGTVPLAAIGFTFPVIMMVFGLLFGVGIGASTVISKAIGKGDTHKINYLTTDSLFLTLLLGVIISIIGLFTINKIFSIIGASAETLVLVKQYMNIWYFGFPFLVIPMVANNAIRATGDTLTPGLIMAFGALLNAVLDPIFIFGFWFIPSMGIRGAAIATVFSRILTMFGSLYILDKKLHMIEFGTRSLKSILSSWKKILNIAVPSAVTHILIPISIGIITRIASSYGDPVVAAIGAGTKIDTFALILFFAMSSALIPFTGQNLGAKRFGRIKKARDYTTKITLIWGISVFFLFLIFAKMLGVVFGSDQEVKQLIAIYLQIISFSYAAIGIIILSTSEFTGLHMPGYATGLNFIRLFGTLVPLVIICGRFFGIPGIFYGITLSNIIAAIFFRVFLIAKFNALVCKVNSK